MVTLFVSCNQDTLPDVSSLVEEVQIRRFDQTLLNLDQQALGNAIPQLKQASPALFSIYFEQLIPLTKADTLNIDAISKYLTDDKVRYMLDTIQDIYPNLTSEEEAISQAFAYLKHYFPAVNTPNFYTLYGDFTYQAFIFPDDNAVDAIGIALDMFLGKDYPYKQIDPQNPIFSDYITKRYTRKYIPKKVVEIVIEDLLGPLKGKRYIDHAIYQGKKLLILAHVFPNKPMAELLEYTDEEYKWCESSELGMWDFVLDQNLIFETNQQKINSYVNEGPRSKGMPEASPGRTAHFLGYKIVKSYLARTGKTISELVRENNTDEIFQQSKYKPKRN